MPFKACPSASSCVKMTAWKCPIRKQTLGAVGSRAAALHLLCFANRGGPCQTAHMSFFVHVTAPNLTVHVDYGSPLMPVIYCEGTSLFLYGLFFFFQPPMYTCSILIRHAVKVLVVFVVLIFFSFKKSIKKFGFNICLISELEPDYSRCFLDLWIHKCQCVV